MEIDRVLMLKILEYLASIAERETLWPDYQQLLSFTDGNEPVLAAMLLYLEKQRHLVSGITMCGDEPMVSTPKMKITEKGLDFLQKDGGLTAEEKVITIRLHAETLALLEKCISGSDIDPKEKQVALKKLKELPASAIEHLLKKLLDEALAHWPGALRLIRSLLL